MSRKDLEDLEEKVKEARRIIEHSEDVSAELGAAMFYVLGELERMYRLMSVLDKEVL